MALRHQFDAILDRLACELPQEFYRYLNGGIIVLDEAKLHPSAPPTGNIFVLGEYRHDRAMGRYIVIYYGSFMMLYPRHSPEQLEPLLRSTLCHEFRHHLESLGGLTTLADEDKEKIERWLSGTEKKEPPKQGTG